MEDAAAANGEANFVFAVGVFFIKLGQHCIEVWRGRVDVDNVSCDESTCGFEAFNFRGICGENFFVGSIGANPTSRTRFQKALKSPESLQLGRFRGFGRGRELEPCRRTPKNDWDDSAKR